MAIIAEVYRVNAKKNAAPWGRMAFEAAPQPGDEVLVGNDSTKVLSARHIAVGNSGGVLTMQYQVLVK